MDFIEGALRVVRFDDGAGYAAVFAPDQLGGGAIPQLRLPTRESLKAFLLDIGFPEATTDEILTEVAAAGTASRHTNAPFEMLRRYGLLQLGVVESILRYLSV